MNRTEIFPSKYCNSLEGSDTIFGICRCEMSCFNRVFASVEAAVSALIAKCKEMILVECSTASFEVIRGATTIYKAIVKQDHSIVYSIDNGIMVNTRSSKKSLIINNPLPEAKLPLDSEANTFTVMSNNTGNFTALELQFLGLDNVAMRSMAQACQTAVINNRTSKDLRQEILELSAGVVCISTTKAWSKNMPIGEYEVDENHILFKDWSLFKKCFGVKNSGKKRLDQVAQTIEDVWAKGRELAKVESSEEETAATLVVTPMEVAKTPLENDTLAQVTVLPNVITRKSALKYISELTTTILVFVNADNLMLSYLHEKGIDPEEEVSSKTLGLLSCTLADGVITLGSQLGERRIVIDGSSIEDVKSAIAEELTVAFLFFAATAHDQVSSLFEVSSIAELYLPLASKFAA